MFTRSNLHPLKRKLQCLLVLVLIQPYLSTAAHDKSGQLATSTARLSLNTGLQRPYYLADNQQKAISKNQAASAAQSKYGGKVLNVSRKGNSYRVKLLQESGRVRIVTVDAFSGKVT